MLQQKRKRGHSDSSNSVHISTYVVKSGICAVSSRARGKAISWSAYKPWDSASFANNQIIVQICLKDAGDNVPNNDTNNILSPLSKHCGGTIDETSPPFWKAFQDNSTNWGIETQNANTDGHF